MTEWLMFSIKKLYVTYIPPQMAHAHKVGIIKNVFSSCYV